MQSAIFHPQFSNRDPRSRRAFTLVELLVVIAVIVILMALLLPAIGMARARGRQTKCASNQHQVWLAWTLASRDERRFTSTSQWTDKVLAYVQAGLDVYYCPDDVDRALASSFGLNDKAQHLTAGDSKRVVLLDYQLLEAKVVGQTFAQLNDATNGWPGKNAPRHLQRLNVTFFDGHTEPKLPDDIDPRYCEYFKLYWRPVRDTRLELLGCTALPTPLPGTTSGTTTVGASTTSTGGGASTGGTGGTGGTTTSTAGTSATTGTTSATSTSSTSTSTTGTTTTTTTGGGQVNNATCVHTADAGCDPTKPKWVRIQEVLVGGNGGTQKLVNPGANVTNAASFNIALQSNGGTAAQSSTHLGSWGGEPWRAIDGSVNQGNAGGSMDLAHTNDENVITGPPPCWEVQLNPMPGSLSEIKNIRYYNVGPYESWYTGGARIEVLGACGNVLYTATITCSDGHIPTMSPKDHCLAGQVLDFPLP